MSFTIDEVYFNDAIKNPKRIVGYCWSDFGLKGYD